MIRSAELTIGPPGCGKTTHIVAAVRADLRRGIDPSDIAVVTFTRAARDEVLERLAEEFGLTEDDLPWVRTIHSAAFRLLGLGKGCAFTDNKWAEFGETHGYDLSGAPTFDDDGYAAADPCSRTADDDLLLVREWGLNRRLTTEAALRRCPITVSTGQFRLFCERAEKFKSANGLIEFADMLAMALEDGSRPEVRVAYIDEAQDLSPLQIALAEMWFRDCEQVEIAADDDQAIYSFAGADPGWLVRYADRVPLTVLEDSKRVPSLVHECAERIIGRNSTRVAKMWRPARRGGTVRVADASDLPTLVKDGRPTFVLVRNRIEITALATALLDAALPFVVDGPGGPNPLGNPRLRIAVGAAQTIARSEAVDAAALRVLVDFVPTRCAEFVLPYGAKARIADLEGPVPVTILRDIVGRGSFFSLLQRDGPVGVMIGLPVRSRRYVGALLQMHGRLPTPSIVLTTIHASKGREADRVVVATDMSRRTFVAYRDPRTYEAENRVWYVAATRTKDELVWLRPRTRRHFDVPRADERGRAA